MGYSKKTNKPAGYGGKATADASPSRRTCRVRPLVIAVIVVILVVVTFLVVRRGTGTGEQETGDKGEKVQRQSPTIPSQTITNTVVGPSIPLPKDPHEGMVLSPVGVWQPTNRPWRANAKKVHNVHTNWSHTARQKVPYRNAVEQMLLTTFTCPLGTCPPPLLRIPRRDMDRLVDILIDKPVAEDDDTLAQIKNKEIIAAAKQEMKEYIKKGGRPENFFKSYHNQLQKAYELRSATIREINRLVTEEGDVKLAREFQDEMNRRFKKEGIKTIHLEIGD